MCGRPGHNVCMMGPSAHQHRGASAQRVRIVEVGPAVLAALAAGDVRRAAAGALIDIPDWFVASENSALWALRSRQAHDDPSAIGWLTGAVVDAATGLVVGFAGYHGPPDESGMVEIGYDIGEEYRRRGYGHAVIQELLTRSSREPRVRTVRATIAPDNAISRALVAAHGFLEVGEQWDQSDGLEIIYETAAVPEI